MAKRNAFEVAQDTAELVRTAVGKSKKHYTTALIAAAGSSTRMGKDISKQLLDVDGIPVLARTLLAFEAAATVTDIVLIARREDFEEFVALAKRYCITKLRKITQGGETRQISVRRGLGVISPKTRFVAIADGARCLITPEQIDAVNRTAYRTGAACAAVPATDTVKIVDSHQRTTDSPDRSTVWLAQTPQTFSLPLYRAAAYYAKETGFEATDDTTLVENIKRSVTLVNCGAENIKITTPQDLYLAHAILARRAAAQKEDV